MISPENSETEHSVEDSGDEAFIPVEESDDEDRETYEFGDLHKDLYENSQVTVGEVLVKILEHFYNNGSKKKELESVIDLLNFVLPSGHKLPKTKYYLTKLINQSSPSSAASVERHRICEKCLKYLGVIDEVVEKCKYCSSTETNNFFINFDLRLILKDAFEYRHLKRYVDQHKREIERDPNYISDLTSGSEYRKLERNVLTNPYDLCMIWNTDGLPISHSSKGQLWLVQVKIVNIPPQNRRNFQFICGIYYSRVKHPNMNSFLKPFVDNLRKLYFEGFDWFDKETDSMIHSIAIAPVATLDTPAKSAVQNMMYHSGEFSCPHCEHPGESCESGKGHNIIFPLKPNPPVRRTHERMIEQADKVSGDESLYHEKGVKGPTRASLIPHFDIATSFVVDYQHCILLGVMKKLLRTWCIAKYSSPKFYIKKKIQDDINTDLDSIRPPDSRTRVPRNLSYINFWKASMLRDFLLSDGPVVLKDRLSQEHYNHFLLLSFGTKLLLQERIHKSDRNLSRKLFLIFEEKYSLLYWKKFGTINAHLLGQHIVDSVEMWGPLWGSNTFTFEDGNGGAKRVAHGTNKLQAEIANTLIILSSYKIIRGIVNEYNGDNGVDLNPKVLGLGKEVNDENFQFIENFCNNHSYKKEDVRVFERVKYLNILYTCELYTRQKTRNNFYVMYGEKYGKILLFFKVQNNIFALVRKLVKQVTRDNQIVNRESNIDLSDYIFHTRETVTTEIIQLSEIKQKITMVKNYVCIHPNKYDLK